MSSGNGRRALVTGGAGFIGGHIVQRLIDEGWAVRVLDNFSSGREENLAECLEQIELIRGDILDPEIVLRAVDGIEVVFHEAAIASVPRSVADPIRTNDINGGGTLQVLECARQAGVRRVVFAASSAAYGNSKALPKRESMRPEPLSPYALQKVMGEQYCHLYTALYGLETVALRYFNVFGPRQDPKSEYAAVIPKFICAALAEVRPTIFGDGRQTRDFVFVGDVARANLLAADSERAPGSVINVAAGRTTTLTELWEGIRDSVGCPLEPVYVDERAGDVRDSVADLGLARELLGFEPVVDLREGLRQTVESFAKTTGPDKR